MGLWEVRTAERIMEHLTFMEYVIGCLARDAELISWREMATHLGHLYDLMADTIIPKMDSLITMLKKEEAKSK